MGPLLLRGTPPAGHAHGAGPAVEATGRLGLQSSDDGILAAVEAFVARFQSPALAGLPPLHGGLVGYLGYDVVREVERLPDAPEDDLGHPDAALVVIGQFCAFDHWRQRIMLIDNVVVPQLSDGPDAEADPDEAARRTKRPARGSSSWRRTAPGRPTARTPGRWWPHRGRAPEGQGGADVSAEEYMASIGVAKEYIRAGDIFQVVLSQRFDLELEADPYDVYRALRLLNPSPYMYFLRFPEVTVVGASPEPMVRLRDGVVISRPIAGSRPRGENEQHDRLLEGELAEDPKELAEHIMLVDLARNDVGRVVRFGTEKVDELMTIERYSHIMHITSQVSGELAEGKGPIDVLRATLPAGTLSGAPKVRAMEIIDELEPTKRGVYGGVVGYIDFSGNVDTAIAIRTMVVTPGGKASVQAGAGIVADSDPQSEDEECAHKAGALLVAVTAARGMTAARMRAAGGSVSGHVPPIDDRDRGPAPRRGRLPRRPRRAGRRGPDAEGYLQGQLSQDVAAAGRGRVGGLAAPRTRRQVVGPVAGDPHRRAGLRARCRPGLRRRRAGPPAPLPPALEGRAGTARLARPVPAGGGRRRGGGGAADGAGRARRAGPALRVERLDRRGSARPPGRGAGTGRRRAARRHHGLWRRRGRGLPHRLGHPRHGHRADEQDHRGRGRPGGAHGQLHQGLLHGPGTGGPPRLPRARTWPGASSAWSPRPATPARPGPRHDAARRRHAAGRSRRPRTRSWAPSPRRPGAPSSGLGGPGLPAPQRGGAGPGPGALG